MQEEHRRIRLKITPIITIALLVLLGFFAFRNGFNFSLMPTGAVTLENTTIIATMLIPTDNEISIPIKNAIVRISSSEIIQVFSGGREVNITERVWLQTFNGKLGWDTEKIVLEGTMEAAHAERTSISWPKRERAIIYITSGIADVAATNLSSFSETATGKIMLEKKWTAQLNQTPIAMKDFEGRVYLQRYNNETVLVFEGNAQALNIEEDNLLKKLV